MAHITDFIENSLEHSEAGKSLDARMGKEILKRPSISIPRLDMQVRKTPTNGISNTVIVKVMIEPNTEFLNHNPIIVLMRKHNAKKRLLSNGEISKHAKNKWVEPGSQWETIMDPLKSTQYLSQQRDFQFGLQVSTWFTPKLISDNSMSMTCDYLLNSFIKNLSNETEAQYSLMGSNGNKIITNGMIVYGLFGLAIRIDNPKFTGDIVTYPLSSMYQREPKYIYGEITKFLFRIEVQSDSLFKSLAIL